MATRNKRKLAAINNEKLWGTSQERIMERFRNPLKIWFRIQYGIHTDTPIILRIVPVQRHASYSFHPCKRRLSHEPANSGQIRNNSGDVPECIWYKPGNEWGRLPEWSSSWSRHLRQPDDTKLWPKGSPWHLLSQVSVLGGLFTFVWVWQNSCAGRVRGFGDMSRYHTPIAGALIKLEELWLFSVTHETIFLQKEETNSIY